VTTALLIIDVQKGMFAFPDTQPFRGGDAVAAIALLLARARAVGAPIVFVKHDGGPGHPLARGEANHAIVDDLAPRAGEPIITKSKCGAFNGTPLKATLDQIGARRLVICGLQSDFCVDTAVRTAVDHGYAVTVASDAHTTFDAPHANAQTIIAHLNYLWPRQFGPVLPAEAITFAEPPS
jgi:nicotinamidase-related amidase